MMPVVGLPACVRSSPDGYGRHDVLARYVTALCQGAGVLPVILPAIGEDMLAILPRLDGLLLTGSPSNVEPRRYGDGDSLTPDRHDPARDGTTLPLIRAALSAGVPLLGICRGSQELNVALGGTLHQAVQELPGRADHRGQPGTPAFRYRPVHEVALSGSLAALLGRASTMVNSSHEQAIDRPAFGTVVEAIAADGTIEAIRVTDAAAFALGVQWHPEWDFATIVDNAALFAAFGDACRTRMRT